MRKKRRWRGAALVLVLMFAALLADSRWRIVTTEYTLKSRTLPESFDGFRIVQLSDVHGAEFGEGNDRLAAMTAAARPDIIAITGDLADSKTDMEVVDALLEKLTDIAPVYYVSGNHEWGGRRVDELTELFDRHGVTYLRNSSELIERSGQSIVIEGVEDPNSWRDMPDPEQVTDSADAEYPGTFKLLLGHRNYWASRYPDLNVDVILCGHAHGGIVRLPFLGGLLGTEQEFFPDYVDGVISSGSYQMVVSRGLGNSIGIPRFLNNPEIVAVTLKKE